MSRNLLMRDTKDGLVRFYKGRAGRGNPVGYWSRQPYRWCDTLMPGDVIDWNGRPRTVRSVSYLEETDHLHSVEFSILSCSWTGKPTTLYGRSIVLKQSKGLIGRRSKYTPLEQRLDEYILHPWNEPGREELSCKDVAPIR